MERYTQMIERVTEREIDTWPIGRPFALAPRMQAITLEVIMAGIFGIEGTPAPGSPSERLRNVVERLTRASVSWIGTVGELLNMGRMEPVGVTRAAPRLLDAAIYDVLGERRGAEDLAERSDIVSQQP